MVVTEQTTWYKFFATNANYDPDRLEYDTQVALGPLVNSVTINWVWLPPWTLDNITDDGREQLRSIGYNL